MITVRNFMLLFVTAICSLGSANSTQVKNSPLGLLVGAPSILVEVAVNSEWTVGGGASFYNMTLESDSINGDIKVSGSAFGGSATWFKNGIFTDGFYFSPRVTYSSATAKSDTDEATASGFSISGLGGYGWFWESGFNMQLGAGLSAPLGKFDVELNGEKYNSYPAGVGLALEWSAGWVF